jgi:GntR family transcriptional repressor for pyruvate dehydrogenase complex
MTYTPSPITRDSVISKAAEEICRLIKADGLRPGTRLPTETQLSRLLGISRNSLREAMRILHGLGFVEKHPGRGIVVKVALAGANTDEEGDADIVNVAPVAFEVRRIVEARCAELAAGCATDADLAELEGNLRLFEEALKRGDLVAATQAHVTFHDVVVRAARNAVLGALYQQVRFIIAEIGRRGAQKTYKNRQQIAVHWDIYRSLAKHDAKAAAAAVERHFQRVGPLIEFMSKNRGVVRVAVGPSEGRR